MAKKAKKENKKLSKEEQEKLVEKYESKNKHVKIDLVNNKVAVPDAVRFIDITDLDNSIRKARNMLKRMGYKTCSREGKCI